MTKHLFLLVAIIFVGVITVVAKNEWAVASAPAVEQVVSSPGDMSLVKEGLARAFTTQPDSLSDAPVAGFYEALYGSEIFYISSDAKHLLRGEIYELETLDNLTEQRRAGGRLKVMDMIPESSMIVYKAQNEKPRLTVFTDIDCVYCRKLHQDIAQINALGITVRYLAYPRAGLNSPSYDKVVSVWCAADRNTSMDNAKGSGKIEPLKCDAPVSMHMQLAEQLGISSTPSLLLDDGQLQPGYAPPPQLLALFQ